MVTCYLKYVIDPYKLSEFEHYAKLWIPLVNKFGGQHHGYFLPSEGANNTNNTTTKTVILETILETVILEKPKFKPLD